MKRKFAITGGTGFVGRHTARELVSRGLDQACPEWRHFLGSIAYDCSLFHS